MEATLLEEVRDDAPPKRGDVFRVVNARHLEFPQRESPQGGSPRVREDPLGTPPSLSLPRKSSENLEKVPRIWEGEGPGGPR